MPGPRLTIFGHLEELRRRILWSLAALAAGFIVAWPRTPMVLDRLLEPLGRPAIFLAPADAFLVTMKVALVLGALLASPVFAWHAASFLAPALKQHERRVAAGVATAGLFSFFAGAWFAIKFLVPAMMGFLMSFATDRLVPQIAADRYFSFVVWTAVGCGVAAEFPIVTAGLSAAGLITSAALMRQWRLAILACLVIAAVVTPSPDVATMLMLAVPLVGLYVIGTVSARFFEPARR